MAQRTLEQLATAATSAAAHLDAVATGGHGPRQAGGWQLETCRRWRTPAIGRRHSSTRASTACRSGFNGGRQHAIGEADSQDGAPRRCVCTPRRYRGGRGRRCSQNTYPLRVTHVVAVADDSGVASPTATMASVAVLRFVNLNADAADMHASDRLIDELIGTLGQVPGLLVVARMSMFTLRDRSLGVRAIPDTLGVASVGVASVGVATRWFAGSCDGAIRSRRSSGGVVVRAVRSRRARYDCRAARHRACNDRRVAPTSRASRRLDRLTGDAGHQRRGGAEVVSAWPHGILFRLTRDSIEHSMKYFELAIVGDSILARCGTLGRLDASGTA